MPKLPSSLDLGARPTPTPGAPSAGYNPTTGAETAPGLALARLGAEMGSSANEIYAAVKLEQDRNDTLRAEDAFNQLRERQLDLTIGEQNGFANLKGEKAVKSTMMTDYPASYGQAVKEIESGLDNDTQRSLFKRRADVSSIQFRQDLLQHAVREREAYAANVYKATMDLEVRQSVARWQDPNAVGLSLERLNAAVDSEAERAAWPKELRDAEKLRAASTVHAAVIGQALASENHVYAQAWYDEHKAEIDPQTAKQLQRSVEDGTQKQLYNGYRGSLREARGSAPALQALERTIAADGKIDETRKETLLAHVASEQDRIQRKAEADREKYLRRVERGISKAQTMVLQGFEVPADQMGQLISAAKGTELEGEVQSLARLQVATTKFRLAPPAAQEAMLSGLEAAVRKNPTADGVTALQRFRSIAEQQRNQVREDPTGFAVGQGLAPATPVDLSRPGDAKDALTERVDAARGMVRSHNAPFKPLRPEEVRLVSSMLSQASAPAKREWFMSLNQSLGGDKEAYSAIMAQLAPDDPVSAVAGEFAARNRADIADVILAGQAILRPQRKEDGQPDKGKLWPMPPETEMRSTFAGVEQNAFAGRAEHRNAVYQTAMAIYAKRVADAGNASGTIDINLWKESIQSAAGKIEAHEGRFIALPYGMNKSQFEDGLKRRVNQFAEQGALPSGITAERLLARPLEPRGDGRYAFMTTDGWVVDKEGDLLIVDFNVAAPWQPSGKLGDAPPDARRDPVTGAVRAIATPKKPSARAQGYQ